MDIYGFLNSGIWVMSEIKLIILDRDGVINQDSDNFIKSTDEWIPIEGSIEAIARLSKAGYTIAVATNQSGIARGLFDPTTLLAMHAKMHSLVAEQGGRVDSIFFCPHGPDDDCDCRKPKPGMMHQIADKYGVDLQGVPAVGDSLRDLQAAESAEANPILVLTGKGEKTRSNPELNPSIPVFANLSAVVDDLLSQ